MDLVEIILLVIGLPIIILMAWLSDKKDKWDDLEFYDEDNF